MDSTEQKVKIRFKFRSGEEFEAEGSPAFIDRQRSDFLQLIGKDAPRTAPRVNLHPGQESPAITRRTVREEVPVPAFPAGPVAPISLGISAAEAARQRTGHSQEGDLRLWEQIARAEDGLVWLRRKSRLLAPDTAALLLVAAAKVLLQARDGYSALALAKSLKKSGYGGKRLDRVLAAELKQGTLRSQGSKRARLYTLSDGGFARAYVLAGKLAQEWQ